MTITVATHLQVVHCGGCAGTYGIDARYYQERREKGGFWNCPYCPCSCGFPAEGSEVARLKRKLEYQEAETERERRRRANEQERHERTRRRLSATQGVVTRTKNRVARGVCPCCDRHFTNLQRHMQTKHPDYENEQPCP